MSLQTHQSKTIKQMTSWIIITLTMLLPNIVQAIRFYFLGQISNDAFSIASNIFWLQIIYEVPQELLLLSLFVMYGQHVREKNSKEIFSSYLQNSLAIILMVFGLMSILISVFAYPIVNSIQPNNILVNDIVHYVRLESIANIPTMIVEALLTALVLINNKKALLKLLFIQVILYALLDYLLFSYATLDVLSIAYSNLIINITWLLITFSLLKKQGYNLLQPFYWNKTWIKKWIQIGSYSGIESLIRNFVFTLIIIKMINTLSMQTEFWIANSIIWGWLLIPFLAFGKLAESQFSQNADNLLKQIAKNFLYVCIFAIILMLTSPVWTILIKDILKIANWKVIIYIIEIQIVFYLFFIISKTIFDPIFYGLGHTKLMLLRSICIDIIYYGIVYLLYVNQYINLSIENITRIFGLGLILNCLISLIIFCYLIKLPANKRYA